MIVVLVQHPIYIHNYLQVINFNAIPSTMVKSLKTKDHFHSYMPSQKRNYCSANNTSLYSCTVHVHVHTSNCLVIIHVCTTQHIIHDMYM